MELEDVKLWSEVKARTTTKIINADFKILCQLHSKYFNHRYKEPCTCNKDLLRLWISELNDKLIK